MAHVSSPFSPLTFSPKGRLYCFLRVAPMSPEAAGWRRAGAPQFFVGATLCGCHLLGGHAGPPLRARQGSSLTGPQSRRRQDASLHSPRFYLLVEVVDPAVLEVIVGDEQPVLERVGERLPRRQLAEHLAHLVHPEPIDEILGG